MDFHKELMIAFLYYRQQLFFGQWAHWAENFLMQSQPSPEQLQQIMQVFHTYVASSAEEAHGINRRE
jgi:hypothetical protein